MLLRQLCVMAVKNNIVPPTINHSTHDPEIDENLNLTLNKASRKRNKLCFKQHIWFWRSQRVDIGKKI